MRAYGNWCEICEYNAPERPMRQTSYQKHIDKLGILDRISLKITQWVGTMYCAIIFAAIALVSFPAAIESQNAVIIVSWLSQSFLQLVLLAVIMNGQSLQGRHTEIQAEEDFRTNIEAEKRIEDLQRTIARMETEKLDKILLLITPHKKKK